MTYPYLKTLGTSGDRGDNQYLQGLELSPPAEKPVGATIIVDSKGLSPLSSVSPQKNNNPSQGRGIPIRNGKPSN
jgi:hypothetical protein